MKAEVCTAIAIAMATSATVIAITPRVAPAEPGDDGVPRRVDDRREERGMILGYLPLDGFRQRFLHNPARVGLRSAARTVP